VTWSRRALLLPAALVLQAGQVESGARHWSALVVQQREGREVRPVLDGETTDLATVSVNAVTLPPGAPLHRERSHADIEELVIVTEGSVHVDVKGGRHLLGPGSVAVVLPGDAHRVENAGTEPATCLVFTYRSKAPPNPQRGRAAGGSFVVDWNTVAVQPTDVGARRQIFDRATTMFERFEMHVSTLNEGLTNHPAHTHRAEEFVLMLRGEVRMLIGETRQDAGPRDLIFLVSQIPHSLDNTGRGAAEYFAFQGQ
jgi:(S)-ureidoglycine aminohydrolase